MSKPLIKWPGGKAGEIRQFFSLIPDYDRYIEPFVGGGALYFHLSPEHAVINDVSEGLMEFYSLVQAGDEEFHRLLDLYDRTFQALQRQCEEASVLLEGLLSLYMLAEEKNFPVRKLAPHLHITGEIAMAQPVMSELITDREEYLKIMYRSVEDKFIRTARNHLKKPFSDADLRENLITGFTGGYYLYFREIFNRIAAKEIEVSSQYRAANFYFVREYCYGSMFRYNRDGAFNIPYGGKTYNKKDFTAKISRIFSAETRKLLERTELYCEDFESLMKKLELTAKDFLFLDPPYDTQFSDYEGKAFAREDHRRLAEFLYGTKAQFLLVIQNNDYISGLYDGRFRVLRFENQYTYNVRSRNERASEHLIITNVPEQEVPWIRENVRLS